MSGGDVSPADLRMGDDLLDALRAHVNDDLRRSAELTIPHLRTDPVTAGSVLMSFAAMAVKATASHTRMSPTAVMDMIWSKPSGSRVSQ
jgi:hypothetical protein